MSVTVEGVEEWLDKVVAEALRRQRKALVGNRADKHKQAEVMAKTRADLRIWRDRCRADALSGAMR